MGATLPRLHRPQLHPRFTGNRRARLGMMRKCCSNRTCAPSSPSIRTVRSPPTVRSNGVLMGRSPREEARSAARVPSCISTDGTGRTRRAWMASMIGGDHHRHWQDGKIDIRKRKTYDQERHEIQCSSQAKAYAEAVNGPAPQCATRQRRCVVFDALALYVHANDVRQITEAVPGEMGIAHLVSWAARTRPWWRICCAITTCRSW